VERTIRFPDIYNVVPGGRNMDSRNSAQIESDHAQGLNFTDADIDALLAFFQILDEWDREQESSGA